MANPLPVSFSDSDNSSSVCYPSDPPPAPRPEPSPNADAVALGLLSANLKSLFASDFCADAFITAKSCDPPTSRKVPVHRCLLSARSPFFRQRFAEKKDPGVILDVKDLVVGVPIGYESLRLVLEYMYTGRVTELPRGVCCCADEDCSHIGCRPAVDFMLEVLYSSVVFQISELVSLFQRRLIEILDKVGEDDMLVILSVANLCEDRCKGLLIKCLEFVTNSTLDVVTLEKALSLSPDTFKEVISSRKYLGLDDPEINGFPNIHVKRILRALDSDDVQLVRLLLKENQTTLDDAYALHYAVAHCDSKITTELLELGIADVNHRNLRGYTVLHVAAMRRDPKIIVSLITKGARPSDTTPDGRKAINIARQLTKLADYDRTLERGTSSPRDRLCVEILENAERANPLVGEAADVLATAGEDLRSRLLYLENRVGLARIFFPEEAKIAMANAKVEGTLEFILHQDKSVLPRYSGSSVDDLNETPFTINEEQKSRMEALSKTVECGRRFFPRCSTFLDNIMDNDMTDIAFHEIAVPETEKKRRRFQELHEDFLKAFSEDKLELSAFSSSSSSRKTTERPRTKASRR